MSPIRIKRIYDPVEPGDGYRILVDRLWPRGMRKEQAALDQWAKSITPSTEIRKEFHHDPSSFSEFRQKYLFELENNPESEAFRRQVPDHPGVLEMSRCRWSRFDEIGTFAHPDRVSDASRARRAGRCSRPR